MHVYTGASGSLRCAQLSGVFTASLEAGPMHLAQV